MPLAITRRVGESIKIGDSVVVTVVLVDGGKVRLSISAPRDIPVRKAEQLDWVDRSGNIGEQACE